MPQASDEDRERYHQSFPDIGCEHAYEELKKHGFMLTKDWCWEAPDRAITDLRLLAANPREAIRYSGLVSWPTSGTSEASSDD